jgi:hypothetical protein
VTFVVYVLLGKLGLVGPGRGAGSADVRGAGGVGAQPDTVRRHQDAAER